MAGTEFDGRRARGLRSRRQILDALATLVVAGDPAPASRVVAEKAGVTQRTLFNHFDHLDSLYAEMGQRQFQGLASALPPVRSTGALDERLDAELDALSAVHERFGSIHSAIQARQSDHTDIVEFLELVRSLRRSRLSKAFGSEIEAVDADSAVTIMSLMTVTSESTWTTLRRDLGCDVGQARAHVAGLVAGVLSGETAHVVARALTRVVDLDVLDLDDAPVIDLAERPVER